MVSDSQSVQATTAAVGISSALPVAHQNDQDKQDPAARRRKRPPVRRAPEAQPDAAPPAAPSGDGESHEVDFLA